MSPAQLQPQQAQPPFSRWPVVESVAAVSAAEPLPPPADGQELPCTWAAALLERCQALAGLHARKAGVHLLPPVVEHGLALMAPLRGLQAVMTALLRCAVEQVSGPGEVQVRAIRQGGRACLSIQFQCTAAWPGLQADQRLQAVRKQLHRMGGSLQLDAAATSHAMHVWLPLARNDPRHPAPETPV